MPKLLILISLKNNFYKSLSGNLTFYIFIVLLYSLNNLTVTWFQGNDFSEAQEGDPKYLAPELMNGKFGKPADVFR